MGTDTKKAVRSLSGAIIVSAALCLGTATDAFAGPPKELPAAFMTLSSKADASPSDEANRKAEGMMAADANVAPRRAPLHVRYRNLKLLSYSREIELLREDVIVKVKSPGRRKSIVMLELKF